MLDIYKTRYQLTDHPFRLSPDHRFSLDHPSYARAKAYLKYAISQGEGFIAITGEPGTGKTTLINGLLAELDRAPVLVATLTCAQLDPRNLIQMVATSFGLPCKGDSTAILLSKLEQFLIKQNRNERHAVLIVDEAQGMSPDSLEELRLLSNLQHGNRLLMQVFLVGQERLLDMIHAPGMEHLQQRLIAASHLEPLSLEETVDYVEHRLCVVGWQGDPAISEDALRLIQRTSEGVPRRINLICHRLFLYGGLEQKHELVADDVRHIVEELHNERVLIPGPSCGDPSEEGIEAEPGDARAPALSLPRAESLILAEQLRRQSMPSRQKTHTAESMQQARSVSPEPGEAQVAPIPPSSHSEPRMGSNAESPQAEPEEPDIPPGQGMGWRLMMVLALLVGLLFAATIDTDLSDRLTGFIFPALVGTSRPATTAANGSEQKAVVLTTGSGTRATNSPDRPPVTKAEWKAAIPRDSAANASTTAGLDSPPVNEASRHEPVSLTGAVQREPHATGTNNSQNLP